MNVEDVISDLQDDEGFRPFAYPDSEGYLTIGFGTLVDPRKGGITMDEGMYLLRNRLATNLGRLDQLRPYWRSYPDEVQRALANMAYQLGPVGVHSFAKMWAALENLDWVSAAREALDSKWAAQTPDRAKRVAAMIRSA